MIFLLNPKIAHAPTWSLRAYTLLEIGFKVDYVCFISRMEKVSGLTFLFHISLKFVKWKIGLIRSILFYKHKLLQAQTFTSTKFHTTLKSHLVGENRLKKLLILLTFNIHRRKQWSEVIIQLALNSELFM